MKKFGFTLAEILITLSIIGVVAAITLPTLMTDTLGAQIGPKLAKAVSMFEQANEAMLHNNSVDAITDAGLIGADGAIADYYEELSNYLKATKSGSGLLAKDGMFYTVTRITSLVPAANTPAHKQEIGTVMIGTNGTKSKTPGEDVFYFSWWNDGSLRPKGGTNWSNGDSDTWETKCALNTTPENYEYCAGHIFENNLKVLYK